MKTLLAGFAAPVFNPDIGWRILASANLLRLLVPPVLALLSRMMSPPPLGGDQPALFAGVATAYFLHAIISIGNIRRRWPDLAVQTLIYVCIDVLAISLLAYASGGVSSGLAALLILSIGAASSVVRQRLALLFAAIAAIGWLIAVLAERNEDQSLLTAAVAGALVFTVILGLRSVARLLWEGREPARAPAVDSGMSGAIEASAVGPGATPVGGQAQSSIELTAWLKEFVTAFWLAEEIDGRTLRLTSLPHDVEVHTDPPRLYQLLWKLCEHAIEHHDATLEPIQIRVIQSTSGRRPLLEIVHRGPGIDAADIELAQKNGIALTYERRPSGHTIFRLAF